MSASIGARATMMRSLYRRTTKSTASRRLSSRISVPAPSVRPVGVALRVSPASTSPRLLRRELSSILPLHSATASARLISKLPDVAKPFEGRFINYLSPI